MTGKWNRSVILEDRLKREGKCYYVGNELYYQGMPVIHRDSKIDGGVCMGGSKREAIIVDSEKYDALKMLFDQTKDRIAGEYNFDPCNGEEVKGNVRYNQDTGEVILPKTISEYVIMTELYKTVNETMKYDGKAVDEIVKKEDVDNDGLITLDHFINKGVGVCRHMALTCGALIELFKKDGHLNGKPSIERCKKGADVHEWCRYTDEYNNVWVLDVAGNFFGELKNATGWWPYDRPGEN